jgi:transposase
MKAYSIDLRERIVQAVDQGMTKARAARTFSVSLATVKNYVRQR